MRRPKRQRRKRSSNSGTWLFTILFVALVCILVTNYEPEKTTSPEPLAKATEIKSSTPITTQVTPNPVKKERVLEKLTEVTIKLKNDPSTTNAKVASKFVDGTVLKPGEIFSYNQIVGERTLEKGFVKAPMPVLQNGVKTIIQSPGSGVCRLSVAIATASDRLNLPHFNRVAHTFKPYYIDTNKSENLSDATVFWPGTDNKFKNTKDYDILINTSVDNNYVLHCVFSKVTWREIK